MIYASEHELERFMGKCKQMIRSGGENVSKEKEILTGFFPCVVVLAEQFMTETLPMGCLWEGLAHTHDVGPKSPKGPAPRPWGAVVARQDAVGGPAGRLLLLPRALSRES